MHYSYYLFAAFVATLIGSVVFLADRLKRSRQNDAEAIKLRETRLFSLYQNIEDLADAMEEYVNETMESLKTQREDLDNQRREMENLLGLISGGPAALWSPKQELEEDVLRELREPEPRAAAPIIRQAKRASAQESSGARPSNTQRVRYLREQGFDEERIAQELSLSIGEVRLMMSVMHK